MVFAGDKKFGQSLLYKPEVAFRDWLIKFIPKFIQGYHLTVICLLWSLLIIVFSFLARYNIKFLWLTSAMIFLHYICDLLDGNLNKVRKQGLIRWGYYMDHFFDYVFLCCILIGYALLLPERFLIWIFFILVLFGAFMVNSFLSFAANNKFRISYMGIGPTEVRIIFIIINTLLIVFGKSYMAPALPYILLSATVGLFITVFRTQKSLWKEDKINNVDKDQKIN